MFFFHRQAIRGEKNSIITQQWKARKALLSSTMFIDNKCITVGVNLPPWDLKYFQALDGQLIHIEAAKIPDLGMMMYHAWCVR